MGKRQYYFMKHPISISSSLLENFMLVQHGLTNVDINSSNDAKNLLNSVLEILELSNSLNVEDVHWNGVGGIQFTIINKEGISVDKFLSDEKTFVDTLNKYKKY
jgi:hypothetical protein